MVLAQDAKGNREVGIELSPLSPSLGMRTGAPKNMTSLTFLFSPLWDKSVK